MDQESITWYHIEYVFRLATGTFDIWVDRIPKGSDLNMRSIALTDTGLFRGTSAPAVEKLYLDLHRVGKYVDPEPAHGAWGDEEAVKWPF